jgi:hypothetical protein
LVVIALIGFAATTAAMQFGPEAVEYVRELARQFPTWPPKSGGAPKIKPWAMPEFKPVWDTSKPPIVQPPSFRKFNFPQGNGMPARNYGGGGR